jgi:hypothetical protein
MAHWAEIDENNIVLRVTVGDNNSPDEGYQWLMDNLGGRWIKTSYNTLAGVHKNGETPLRKNFAGIGMIYNEDIDGFITPQPFSSWILNQETGVWESPVLYPDDENIYTWNESTLSWDLVE